MSNKESVIDVSLASIARSIKAISKVEVTLSMYHSCTYDLYAAKKHLERVEESLTDLRELIYTERVGDEQ